MKCPYCNYEHGWSGDELDTIEGDKGEFFTFPNDVIMTRDSPLFYGHGDVRIVFGCPSCSKIFMGN